MRNLIVTALVAAVASFNPGPLLAADTLREAAARAAANRSQPDDDAVPSESGRSPATTLRILLGLTLIGGGATLLALDPAQPTQPALVTGETIAAASNMTGLPGPTYRHADPWWDRVLMANYTEGVGDGVNLVLSDGVLSDGREIYAGPFQPYRKRAAYVKYGGLAAIALGAVLVAYRGGGDDLQMAAGPGYVSVRATVGF